MSLQRQHVLLSYFSWSGRGLNRRPSAQQVRCSTKTAQRSYEYAYIDYIRVIIIHQIFSLARDWSKTRHVGDSNWHIITISVHALWLVNQLWFIVPVTPRKNGASSELLYKSNRPQVSMVYRLINHLGCWKNTRTIRKSLACGSWFTNFSRVLPTSRVVYQPTNYWNLVYFLNNDQVSGIGDRHVGRLNQLIKRIPTTSNINRSSSSTRIYYQYEPLR